MVKTAVFKSNRRLTMHAPKAVTLSDVKQVDIISVDNSRIIMSALDSWFDDESASPDFMPSREQPGEQDREAF
ncbi:AbrB/MazE/SpoVT family DNA-binding domain-containing protein [Kosakonia cowanii]|uniref:AbrB/MazE/SpoVT family DNA-binding domain-containing protein n=1 Tax=Kosakonia cowanii TaxID=208223 RepID=UPI003EEA349D